MYAKEHFQAESEQEIFCGEFVMRMELSKGNFSREKILRGRKFLWMNFLGKWKKKQVFSTESKKQHTSLKRTEIIQYMIMAAPFSLSHSVQSFVPLLRGTFLKHPETITHSV